MSSGIYEAPHGELLYGEGRPVERKEPSIEQQVAELKAAGWTKVRGSLWKAPVGGYFRGPHGAWLVMKRRGARDA